MRKWDGGQDWVGYLSGWNTRWTLSFDITFDLFHIQTLLCEIWICV